MSPAFIRAQVQVVLDERVPVFAAGLGDPSWVVPLAREPGMTTVGLAGTVRNAVRHARVGVDIIVAQGHEAGDHTGKIANFSCCIPPPRIPNSSTGGMSGNTCRWEERHWWARPASPRIALSGRPRASRRSLD
jgi:hypothetical protein